MDFTNKSVDDCSVETVGLCRLGDMSGRHGTLDISGKITDSSRISRKMFTDSLLPLTGPHGILGKSFVMYDDHGPKARGERMACSMYVKTQLRGAFPRKNHPRSSSGSEVIEVRTFEAVRSAMLVIL